ncbi:hypothetical protein FOH24_12890 [Acetobacter tropicalis]|uniref:DUF2635 domain-containing protein n=1 Tax=Acetobacter tropicalis TaxID=104102 RepID=A0A094YUL4_9PROT|nr:hypothetical protein [Acetobacter tropicalis]KAA8387873.1 hypothetical protein FOH24_12890 [Acetobacter tropicalis]KAA8388786.1 hypothetical protein FOH22_08200 [Acetobacter tropicalis]KGB24269.1 hypothetical protein AtDm6_1267 [Acetobacter tropicalis]MDO8172376.1 hypothetical protein [Acetobacter tropicalis]
MTVRVTVAKGRVVRDQHGRKCPDGEFPVDEKDFFWSAHIRSGDLELVKPKVSDTAAAVPEPSNKVAVK